MSFASSLFINDNIFKPRINHCVSLLKMQHVSSDVLDRGYYISWKRWHYHHGTSPYIFIKYPSSDRTSLYTVGVNVINSVISIRAADSFSYDIHVLVKLFENNFWGGTYKNYFPDFGTSLRNWLIIILKDYGRVNRSTGFRGYHNLMGACLQNKALKICYFSAQKFF